MDRLRVFWGLSNLEQLDVLATLAKMYKAKGLPLPEQTDHNTRRCIELAARMRSGPARLLFEAPSTPLPSLSVKALAKEWKDEALTYPLEYVFIFSQLIKTIGGGLDEDPNIPTWAHFDEEDFDLYGVEGFKSYAELEDFWSKFKEEFAIKGRMWFSSLVIGHCDYSESFVRLSNGDDWEEVVGVRRFQSAPRPEQVDMSNIYICRALLAGDWPSRAGGAFGSVYSHTRVIRKLDDERGWVDSDAAFVDVLSRLVDWIDRLESSGWWPALPQQMPAEESEEMAEIREKLRRAWVGFGSAVQKDVEAKGGGAREGGVIGPVVCDCSLEDWGMVMLFGG
uniref:Uncharacterized protein n=1 Tax=Chromera velia CCMP2878 TaxID=1169474 RepID=A0A0G4EZ45_9ALVE|eukprot:Cvel_14346.t1-p1 / transcript=Cvel_14346.t1 / gene=Cvel_14346 / organism=Chromera_velia_CCMP2878 / gene_product=hypothetical protein / transcript_product=hypothetical protein / location=Cvel_scaffold1016:44888-45895(-) / protein_length=336 / sequence_SO=supercontig / SO=protein_coding / is_pseudo=false